MKFAFALLLLNALLSFTSWWPTVAVRPDARIAPEFTIVLVGLALAAAVGRTLSRRGLAWLASAYLVLMTGRYIDVVAPTLFGRPISLYWDVPQLPRFVWVTVTGSPLWLTLLVLAVGTGIVVALHRLVAWSLIQIQDGLVLQARRPQLWLVLMPLSALIGANYAGVQATWPYVSKPVMPVYARELGIVVDALIPERANRLLPPSDTIEIALRKAPERRLAALGQRDVMLMFLESHGAVMYDNPAFAQALAPSLDRLEASVLQSGRGVVSAFFRSATIGGASDLAHLSLLSGIDLSDPRRLDLLVTTRRPTLLSVFRQTGYSVVGLYHSVHWDWVERSYYGFDTYVSGPDLGYTGPAFGFWKIPDQFALARLEQLHPRLPDAPPRLTVVSTMSTHFPFVPVPPYQPDWDRLLGPQPFDEADARAARAQTVNWLDMAPDYLRTLHYAHTWLAGWFERPEPRDTVFLMVGDHQPTRNIAGEDANWDVPVYVVTRDRALLERFRAAGFSEGMRPAERAALGGLHDLTSVLLKAFNGEPADLNAPRAKSVGTGPVKPGVSPRSAP